MISSDLHDEALTSVFVHFCFSPTFSLYRFQRVCPQSAFPHQIHHINRQIYQLSKVFLAVGDAHTMTASPLSPLPPSAPSRSRSPLRAAATVTVGDRRVVERRATTDGRRQAHTGSLPRRCCAVAVPRPSSLVPCRRQRQLAARGGRRGQLAAAPSHHGREVQPRRAAATGSDGRSSGDVGRNDRAARGLAPLRRGATQAQR